MVPGRVEFVGKHVDYAGGRSLTCAIDAAIHATASPIEEAVLRVIDDRRGAPVTVPLGSADTPRTSTRASYAAAVARRFGRDFPRSRSGVEVVLRSDLPPSAGLSSSSALVVALAMALVDANDLEHDPTWRAAVPTAIARAEYFAAMETGAAYGSFAGDGGVGVRGGAQDHVAIVCAQQGEVGQFSYLPPRVERFVTFPPECLIAIAVSGVHAAKRGNARTAYNRLSDAMREFAMTGFPNDPASEVADRVAQFREETDVIVPGVANAIRDRDYSTLGALVDRSQDLAERVLGNQVQETIFLAKIARERGAIAASAFGAGFGGAVWAMVPRDDAAQFVAGWRARYEHAFPARRARARWLLTGPAGPAARVS